MRPLPNPTSGSAAARRPREVTLGAMQAVAGSVMALVLLISTAQQINGHAMTDALNQAVANDKVATLNLTLDEARTLLRYTIMALAVLCAASLVLGVFVLRRHRAARIALTAIGGVVAVGGLIAGPVGWVATLYIGVSIFLIWSRPARAWFAEGAWAGPGAGTWPGGETGSDREAGSDGGASGPPEPGGYGPPSGPRRDVGGVLPPPAADAPESGPRVDAPPAPRPSSDAPPSSETPSSAQRPSSSAQPPPPPRER